MPCESSVFNSELILCIQPHCSKLLLKFFREQIGDRKTFKQIKTLFIVFIVSATQTYSSISTDVIWDSVNCSLKMLFEENMDHFQISKLAQSGGVGHTVCEVNGDTN